MGCCILNLVAVLHCCKLHTLNATQTCGLFSSLPVLEEKFSLESMA